MSTKLPHELLRAAPASEKPGPALETARPRYW